jgi:hypothetical protein
MNRLTERVLPYIKSSLVQGFGQTDSDSTLGYDDSPVCRDLNNGLLVCYVVNNGSV